MRRRHFPLALEGHRKGSLCSAFLVQELGHRQMVLRLVVHRIESLLELWGERRQRDYLLHLLELLQMVKELAHRRRGCLMGLHLHLRRGCHHQIHLELEYFQSTYLVLPEQVHHRSHWASHHRTSCLSQLQRHQRGFHLWMVLHRMLVLQPQNHHHQKLSLLSSSQKVEPLQRAIDFLEFDLGPG